MKRVYIDLSRCVGCKTCELSCSVAHSPGRRPETPISIDLFRAIGEADKTFRRVYLLNISPFYYPNISMPLQCRHCENPPCMAGCMVDAIYKEDDKVLIKLDRCIGCRMCMMLCPYGAINFRKELGKVLKCDLCPDEYIPACVDSCPTKALLYLEDEELIERRRRELVLSIGKTLSSPKPTLIALG